MPKVININGTSDTTCKCGSWLEHWKNFSRQSLPYHCCEKYCINTNLVGAHVQISGSDDNSWYIVPLCYTHNSSTKELKIVESVMLVPANKSLTCEK